MKDLQASHICDENECINPRHVVPETTDANLKRDKHFKFRSAATCDCYVPCLFVRDGIPLVCRNNAAPTECQCNEECFLEGMI